MIWRYLNFKMYNVPVPVLLRRDITLFLALSTYFGTILLSYVFGATGLSREPLWIIPRGIMVLAAMTYWVWVEYHLEDGKD